VGNRAAEVTYDGSSVAAPSSSTNRDGRCIRWVPETVVKGIGRQPIPGYRSQTANILRLWKAEATESFDFEAFNVGDYYGAVEQKVASETISKVLYPNDEPQSGKQLRLQQQYFFVSCSLQDMIRLQLESLEASRTAGRRN
jgi:starch phosphorylase